MNPSPSQQQDAPTAELIVEHGDDGVVTLTLNRPGARNALSASLLGQLSAAQLELASDTRARVIIVAGAGPVFCAGHDLREVQALPDAAQRSALFAQCSEVMLGFRALPQPVIAQVHGVATAAGCQLAASCDLVVAGASARFATPGVNIGLFCSTPAVALSRVVQPRQAMEMLLTGALVDAEIAQRFGLVNRVVPDQDLQQATRTLARELASRSALTLRLGKQAFYAQLGMTPDQAYEFAGTVMAENLGAQDAAEGISAFLEKRPPVWRDC